MRRAIFAMLAACGSASPRPTTVEVAQPLPSVTASASSQPVAMPVSPSRTDAADVRDLRNPPRAQRLVQNEALLLERLLAAMAASSPDRPSVLHRLAESYVELRKSGDASASTKAIARYAELASSSPSYAKIDEVTYYLGLEQELTRDFQNARRTYYELIKTYPSSRFVPYAYYAFGEMFADEAKGDPTKWMLAEQAYRETMKFTTSPAIANAATCRLAVVFDARGDARRAEATRSRAHDCGGG